MKSGTSGNLVYFEFDDDLLEKVQDALGNLKGQSRKVLKLAINDTAKQAKKLLAKKAQETTRTVFRDALEEFAATVRHDGGELEKKYRAMLAAYERCEAKAKDLHARIDDVERVSKSLFKEWETEMQEYGNADYRARSREQLSATRSRCQDMISAMRRAEAKIPPVLTVLHDQVLFLKHNLNASALRSLAGEEAKIEADVASLIEEMNRAIAESEAFIATLES